VSGIEMPEMPALKLFAASAPDHGEPVGSISIPVRDHLNAATVTSLVTSASGGGWLGPGEHVDFNIVQGSIVTLQRNELVQRMRGGWLLFIDDDMVWQPGQIKTLIEDFEEHDLDMLGALCFRRSPPFQPTMYMRESPTGGAYNFLEDWEPGEIKEVDATGMAFIVIRKRVFERMVALYEDREGWVMPPYDVRIQQPPPNFFRWEGQLGEDLRFCQEAKAAGCRVFVHTGVEVGHVAEVQIGHRDFLRELAGRDPGLVEERRQVNTAMGLPTMETAEARSRLGW
jgi:hypothetical protein